MNMVTFHGNEQETSDILAAYAHNCTCQYGPEHLRETTCPGHHALAHDQQFVDDQLFARWRAEQMREQEWSCEKGAPNDHNQ
jgi:hypothetical protein